MPIQKLRPTFTFTEERLKQLEQVVPEAFADGKIDWETLQEALGEELEDGREEHFGLNWPGKRESYRKATIPPTGTLLPCPGEGVNEEKTENIFIDGENLEVLKILQKSYAGMIKMIYIDPPYNTGNDFIYNDDFTDPLDAYLKYINAFGERGEVLTTNTRADGRFHARWLSTMFPRLRLAHKLLREDGIMFVSIDDNEVHNLRHIMNEIFGEENFITQVVWQRAYAPVNLKHHFSQNHDHLLVYAKSINNLEHLMLPRTKEADERYLNPDADPRGVWTSDNLSVGPPLEKNIYPITTPSGRIVYPPSGYSWRYSREKFVEEVKDNRIWFGERGDIVPRIKRFLSEVKAGITPMTVWTYEEVGHTQDARKELKELFDDEAVFDYPKPVKYIRRMLDIGASKDDSIVLDFFSGSATTAHAVLQKNVEEQKNLKFIMVQMHELNSRDDYPSIAEIGKERVRRAISRLKEANPMFSQDLGFKVFTWGESNFKTWTTDQTLDPISVKRLFEDQSNPLKEKIKPVNLLTELFLIEGFPLTSKVRLLEDHLQNQLYCVSAPGFCTHDLYVCLDEIIQPATVDLLQVERHDIFICLDSALTDEMKVRLADRFNVHII